jgi:hypothetical protein
MSNAPTALLQHFDRWTCFVTLNWPGGSRQLAVMATFEEALQAAIRAIGDGARLEIRMEPPYPGDSAPDVR